MYLAIRDKEVKWIRITKLPRKLTKVQYLVQNRAEYNATQNNNTQCCNFLCIFAKLVQTNLQVLKQFYGPDSFIFFSRYKDFEHHNHLPFQDMFRFRGLAAAAAAAAGSPFLQFCLFQFLLKF